MNCLRTGALAFLGASSWGPQLCSGAAFEHTVSWALRRGWVTHYTDPHATEYCVMRCRYSCGGIVSDLQWPRLCYAFPTAWCIILGNAHFVLVVGTLIEQCALHAHQLLLVTHTVVLAWPVCASSVLLGCPCSVSLLFCLAAGLSYTAGQLSGT